MPDGKNYEGNFQSDTSIKVGYIVESCKHPIDFIGMILLILICSCCTSLCLSKAAFSQPTLEVWSESTRRADSRGVLIVEE